MSTNTQGTLPDYPLVYATEPVIRLAIVYNPFDLTSTAKHELVYGVSKTLADYMVGLPEEVEWNVAYNGELVAPADWATTKPQPFSNITIVRVPEGGGGDSGKTILRVVALIAVMAFAVWAGPMLAAAMVGGSATAASAAAAAAGTSMAMNVAIATSAIGIAGSMAVNMLLAPKAPSQERVSTAYGIDGAKNTAREGIVIPVTYGDFRVGGNIVDLFTRNFGEDQYLYIRTVLNDGEIEGMSEIELNGQPLSSYNDVQTRQRMGKITEEPNDWFDESVRQFNRSAVITTDWMEHVTDDMVDRLRADVLFPSGIFFAKDDGRKIDATVTLQLEHSPVDGAGVSTGAWSPLPLRAAQHSQTNGTATTVLAATDTATIRVQTQDSGDGTWTVSGEYREVGTSTWIDAGTMTGEGRYELDQNSAAQNDTSAFGEVGFQFNFPTTAAYEVRLTGGATSLASISGTSTQTNLTVTGKSSRTLRLTYESANLTRQRYAIRIRRTTPDDETDKRTDECWLSDFGEIDNQPTNVNGTANLSLRVKMTDQLSGIPTLTTLLAGSKVNIYNDDGEVIDFRKSANPADIVADMLLHPTRGGEYANSKMVWPRYVEFREHCDSLAYTFNGTFDAVESLWDTAQTVAARGHGTVIPRGTKFSFIIDRATDHEMIFTPSNMHKDTFKTTWVATAERANEINLTFFDRLNGHKQRVVRVTDNAAFARGDKQKVVSASGFGIVDVEEAIRECEFAARTNRYIKKTVEFDAPLEAIGLTIGDVALVQHDSMDFKGGAGGRLKSGSTLTSIKLDRPVTMVTGKEYRLLVVESAIKRYDLNITAISGTRLTVTGLPGADPNRIRRLIQAGTDVEVLAVAKIGSTWRITVDDESNIVTGPCEAWDTDVIEERVLVTVPGTTETVTVATPMTETPSEYANWMFGETVSLKQPFRLRSISGDDVDRRSLSFVQYDARVYERGGFETIETVTPVRTTIGQVRMLMADYERQPAPDQTRLPVTFSWQRPAGVTYAGADLYVQLGEDTVWSSLGSVTNATSFQRDFSRGDLIRVKAVAFDTIGNRASFNDAPITSLFLTVFDRSLEAPLSPIYEVPYYRVDATAYVRWSASPDGSTVSYRVETKPLTLTEYNLVVAAEDETTFPGSVTSATDYVAVSTPEAAVEIPRLDLGQYLVRIRTEKGYAVSPWAYLPMQIEAPALPTRVTGLRLNMGDPDPLTANFGGRDAKFIWNDVAASASGVAPEGADLNGMDNYFRDYMVRITTPAGTIIREEYVRDSSYTYSLEKNIEDHAALSTILGRRRFRIEVYIRGRQGQTSSVSAMEVYNAAPSLPAVTSVTPGVDGFVLNLERPVDSDAAGTLLWVSETNGFTPSPANLVFQDAGVIQWKGEPRKTYYYRYAAYDAYGTDELNVSAQQTTATTGLNNTYFDPTFYDGVIPADVMNRIALVDGDGPGSVNARVAGVNTRVTNEVGTLNARIDTVTSTAGNRIFYGSTAPVAGAINDVWINPSDNNRVKRWDGDSWEYSDDTRISSLTGTVSDLSQTVTDNDSAMATRVNTVESNAASRNRTFRQATAPTNPIGGYALTLGDLWYATNENNKVYRWAGAGTGWQVTSDSRIEETTARVGLLETAVSSPTGSVATRISEVSAIANARNRTYRQSTTPTAPVQGDLWIDTTVVNGLPGNLLKRWSGTAWEETSDSRIAVNAAVISAHEYALANDNGSVAQAVNAVRAQALARNRTFYQGTAPAQNGTNLLVAGDMWVNSADNNRAYRWSSTAWVEVTDPRTALNTAEVVSLRYAVSDPNGSTAQSINTVSAVANARNRTFRQASAPSSPVLGDIWIDTTVVGGSEGNVLKRWNGAAWIATSDSRIAESIARLTVAENAITTNDTATGTRFSTVETSVAARVRTFAQTAAPANPAGGIALAVGDMWYDTDANNRAYRWNGSAWAEVTDPRTETNTAKIAVLEYAYSDASGSIAQRFSTVEATAAARNRTFYQGTTPAGAVLGDLWIRSDLNNRIFRWNGSAWVETTDTRTADNVARVGTLEYAVTNPLGSVAQRFVSVESSFSGLNTTVTQHTTSIDGIKAEWGIQVNNNGAISGIALTSTLMANGAFSTFKVEADRVEFVAPGGGSGLQPFTYDAANGRIIAQNMLLRGQLEVQSAGGGMRTQITNSGMNVYDASNTLRVRLGVW